MSVTKITSADDLWFRDALEVTFRREKEGLMLSFEKALVAGALATITLSVASSATAQAIPKGSSDDAKPVSTGKTDVTSEKFQGATRDDEKDKKDATELTLSAGGMQNGGNSRLLALTSTGRFRYRREDNQLKVVFAGNYGMTAKEHDTWQTTVENLQGVERYDRFFGDWVLFFASQQRHDRFQGLDLRLQLDPGVGYYFINEKAELLWLEGGYDFRYDVRRDDALTQLDDNGKPVLDASGQAKMLDRTTVVHSARLFAGYELKINKTVSFTSGIEYLQSVTDADVYRLNSDAALTAKIGKSFAIAIAFTERYENRPLPGKSKLDTGTSASLVYSVF